MALVVLKHIELKTGISIRKYIEESKKIVTIKAEPTKKMKELIAKLETPH